MAYLGLAVICYWHAWTGGLASTAQVNGDAFDSMWYLTWAPHSLFHLQNPLFSDYANYPLGINLLINTSALFLGFIGSPITLLFGPIASYNVLVTLSLAGSAAAAYFVIRRWASWRWAAAVGGLVYGFSPYEMGAGLGHLFLVFSVLPPLIFLLLHDILVRQTGRPYWRGALLGLMLVAQFFVALEVLASTLVMGIVLVVLIAIAGRHVLRSHVGYAVRALGVAGVISVALLAYPLWFFLEGPQHVNGPVQTTGLFRADLLGIVVPDSLQRFAPQALATVGDRFAGDLAENGSYLGITLVLIVVVGCIWLRRMRAVKVVAAFGLIAFVLSLGSVLAVKGPPVVTLSGEVKGVMPLPGALLSKLPLFGKALPVRYSLYVALAAAFLLSIILDRLHDGLSRQSPRRRIAAVVAPLGLGLLGVILLVPDVPFAMASVTSPTYFTSRYLQEIPKGSPVVVYPYSTVYFGYPSIWQAQTYLHFRLPGGYYSVPTGPKQELTPILPGVGTPPTTVALVFTGLYNGAPTPITPALRNSVNGQLRAWHVHTVLAFPFGNTPPSQVVAYLTTLLGSSPVRQADAYVWRNLHP